MAAVEGGLELVQKKPEGADDDVLVACSYDTDGGEYVMHKIWTKKEITQRFGDTSYTYSLQSSCTMSHRSIKTFFWFTKAKFDFLTAQNRPKDKAIWGCPTTHGLQKLIKRKEREAGGEHEEEQKKALPPRPSRSRQAKVNHKVMGLGRGVETADRPRPVSSVSHKVPGLGEEQFTPPGLSLAQPQSPRAAKLKSSQSFQAVAGAAAGVQEKPSAESKAKAPVQEESKPKQALRVVKGMKRALAFIKRKEGEAGGEGAEDDVLVACNYDTDGGEYVMHKIWTKKEFIERFRYTDYTYSLRSSCTMSHKSSETFFWFTKAKFDFLTAQNRPKDKAIWGCPIIRTLQQLIKRKEREAGEDHKEQGLGNEQDPPAKRLRAVAPAPVPVAGAAAAAFTPVAAPALVQDSLLVAHLQEALKSERKDKERAWEQNNFLKDELARSRQDIEALRGKAQELAALLGAAQALSGGAVTPSNAAAAAAAMDVVMGGDDLLL